MHIDEVIEYNRLYRIDQAIHDLQQQVAEQNKRIEKMEAVLREVARCLIDGKVDMAAIMPGELHGHRILGSESVQTMVEVYHRLKTTK